MILALSAVAGAVVFTAGAVIFMALLFAAAFKFVRPSILMDDYVPCAGGWHEAELNSCSQGLLKLPQQPVNTYSNLAYLAAGLFPAIVLKTPPLTFSPLRWSTSALGRRSTTLSLRGGPACST